MTPKLSANKDTVCTGAVRVPGALGLLGHIHLTSARTQILVIPCLDRIGRVNPRTWKVEAEKTAEMRPA